jgi:hypothetical protein
MAMSGYRLLTESDVNNVETIKSEQYGAIGQTEDGRKYRYVGADSSGLAAGKLAVTPARAANHANLALASTSKIKVGEQTVDVTVATTAVTDLQYLGGYLLVNDGPGAGQALKIAGHSTITSAGGTVTIHLGEPIRTALVLATSKVTLIASPWAGVTNTATLGSAVGVAPVAIPASNFGWVQTKGIAGVLSAGVITKGYPAVQSQSIIGALAIGSAATDAVLGYAPEATVDTKYGYINLKID